MCDRLLAGGRGGETHLAGGDAPLPEAQAIVR
jgi:hypothetical protein